MAHKLGTQQTSFPPNLKNKTTSVAALRYNVNNNLITSLRRRRRRRRAAAEGIEV
jgi:hypothetical protein